MTDPQPPTAASDPALTGTALSDDGPALPPPDGPPPGTRRGPYTVVRPHAQGGLGRVCLARDPELGRDVAVKEIRPDRLASPGARERFLAEAAVTGQLEHPGVVPIYTLGEAGGAPFYAMRFIAGQTLAEAIAEYHRRPSPLGLRGLLGRFVAVCQTVAFAHSKGVVHRDLKPHNVMLGPFGQTLLLDWGLAKRLDDPAPPPAGPAADLSPGPSVETPGPATDTPLTVDYAPAAGESPGLTRAGEILGTPAYMAPEQADPDLGAVGLAADVYSLGAILYEILTGQPPYSGDPGTVVRALRQGPPVAAERRGRGVPPTLAAVCGRAMGRRPGQRYESAAALAADVEHWLADEPVSVARDPLTVRLTRWGRRNRTLALGALFLLLAVAVALGPPRR